MMHASAIPKAAGNIIYDAMRANEKLDSALIVCYPLPY